jgi:hypothetical protein
MKTIRSNAFETNSSSTHSITIDRANYPNLQVPKVMTIEGANFGWEHVRFNDFYTKASYFWTLALYSDVVKERMLRLSAEHGFDLVWPRTNNGWSTETYIDHGSEHYADWIQSNPELDTDAGLWEFLTSESSWIMLGNDNGSLPPNWKDSPKATDAMPYRVYLIAEDPSDYISLHDYELKVATDDLKANEESIYSMLNFILESERKSYKDPDNEYDAMDDNGNITIDYYNWNYKTRKKEYTRKRKIRVVISK